MNSARPSPRSHSIPPRRRERGRPALPALLRGEGRRVEGQPPEKRLPTGSLSHCRPPSGEITAALRHPIGARNKPIGSRGSDPETLPTTAVYETLTFPFPPLQLGRRLRGKATTTPGTTNALSRFNFLPLEIKRTVMRLGDDRNLPSLGCDALCRRESNRAAWVEEEVKFRPVGPTRKRNERAGSSQSRGRMLATMGHRQSTFRFRETQVHDQAANQSKTVRRLPEYCIRASNSCR